ncbi:MAG: thiamine-phosphate kinase [Planctomycetota bacterium]
MSELAFLDWLQRRQRAASARIVVDRGDDCAVVRIGKQLVLFKVDTVVEGVHFERGTPWRLVGRKAIARALSDIAAMGGVATFAVVALVVRRSMAMRDVQAITRGLESMAVPIVGGDTKSHDGPCVVSVTLLGEMRGARPVLRRGARAGDVLMVTGPLGGSIAGHHLRFTPRLREGRLFATRLRVHAMIDVSDGLARDLSHLRVGADLEAEQIPRRGSLRQALYDGEDYELLVAAAPGVARQIERAGLAIRIGQVSARAGIRLHHQGGRVEQIVPRGYEHRFGE